MAHHIPATSEPLFLCEIGCKNHYFLNVMPAIRNKNKRDFLGGPAAKLRSQCKGPGLDP